MPMTQFEVVTIESRSPGIQLNVTDAQRAAEILSWEWPERRGNAYARAVQISMAHFAGLALATDVRDAFIAAAKEARIFVREGRLLN
jgi:Protein of unknown function (DUF982)